MTSTLLDATAKPLSHKPAHVKAALSMGAAIIGWTIFLSLSFPLGLALEEFQQTAEFRGLAMVLALSLPLVQWLGAAGIAYAFSAASPGCPAIQEFSLTSEHTKQVYLPAFLLGMTTTGVLLLAIVGAMDRSWWPALAPVIAVTQVTVRFGARKLKKL